MMEISTSVGAWKKDAINVEADGDAARQLLPFSFFRRKWHAASFLGTKLARIFSALRRSPVAGSKRSTSRLPCPVFRLGAASLSAFVLSCGAAHGVPISSSIALDDPTGVTSLVVGLIGPSGPGSIRLPITGNVTGITSGEAAAGTTGLTAVATELTPSAGPGVILTAGPPAVGGTVAYPVTTNTHSNIFGSATATTRGLIRGTPSGPGGGVINTVSIVALTPTSATTTGHAYAAATAKAQTDPFVLEPLATDMFALLAVNLLSNYPADPSAQFSLTAQGSASVKFQLEATTNIPGLPTLFHLSFGLDSTSSAVGIDFSSPLMGSAPILPSDFTMVSTGSRNSRVNSTACTGAPSSPMSTG